MPNKKTHKLAQTFSVVGAPILAFVLAVASGLLFIGWSQSAEASKDSCPLSPGKKIAAVKAFKGLAPLFQEPRCLNCHGAVNPFSKTGGHGGGYIDIRKEMQEFLKNPDFQNSLTTSGLKEIAQSLSEITDNDLIRAKAFDPMRKVCKECHIFAWFIPMSHNYFVNRSAKEMCIHIKTSSLTNSPVSFLRHMQDDELVLEGFKGKRGLLEATVPAPPQIPFSKVEKLANDWIEAMGGKFHQPPDCGCTAGGIVLSIRHRIHDSPESISSKIGQTIFDGEVRFDVILEPEEAAHPGLYRGRLSLVRQVKVGHIKQCAGVGSQDEDWDILAFVDAKAKTMQLQFGIYPSNPRGTWTCQFPGGHRVTAEVLVDLFSDIERLEMPSTTGAKKEMNLAQAQEDTGRRESLTVTVVEGLE